MGFPIKTCVVCGDEFELRPDKPGFANRCWTCSTEEAEAAAKAAAERATGTDRHEQSELDAARRKAIKQMLYTRES